jgi:hypothetical protein
MKHLIGLLYLATALTGFYWSIYLTLTGLYGLPFSRWYIVIFIGAVVLLTGAVLWWVSTSPWTRLLPIIGSVLLCSYFVPAAIVLIREGRMDSIRLAIVTLALVSLVVAVKERHVAPYPELQRRQTPDPSTLPK